MENKSGAIYDDTGRSNRGTKKKKLNMFTVGGR